MKSEIFALRLQRVFSYELMKPKSGVEEIKILGGQDNGRIIYVNTEFMLRTRRSCLLVSNYLLFLLDSLIPVLEFLFSKSFMSLHS